MRGRRAESGVDDGQGDEMDCGPDDEIACVAISECMGRRV